MRFLHTIAAISLAAGLVAATPASADGENHAVVLDERGEPCTTKTTSTSTTSTGTTKLSSTSASISSTSSSSSSSKSSASSLSSSTSSSASPTSSSQSTSTSSATTIISKVSSVTSTSTSTSAIVTPTIVQSAGGFMYGACAAEPFYNGVSGQRALTDTSTTLTNMTVEACASFCSVYNFFGVEYSNQCYCGNVLQTGTTQDADSSNCNGVCAGNSAEYCGGSGHMNLYGANSAATSSISALPSAYTAVASASTTAVASASTTAVSMAAVATAGVYNFVVCALEPFEYGLNTRVFADGQSTNNVTSMTVEMCAAFCSASNYNYMGVEYADECYCGNTINTGTTTDSTGGCNMACAGNAAEQCGGAGRMNFYELNTLPSLTLPSTYIVSTTSSSSTSTATSAATTTAQAVSTSTASANSGAGTATTNTGTATASVTTISAAVVNAVNTATTATIIATSTATLVSSTSRYTALGCFQDAATRVLPNSPAGYCVLGNTASTCANACSAAGYVYSGVEYGLSCWCGTTVPTTSLATSSCGYTCTGNSSQTCGGYYAISVSKDTVLAVALASSSTSATKTSATTATASAAATVCAPPSVATTACTSMKQNFGALIGNYSYSLYYYGQGYTESKTNPGNTWPALLPPITMSIASSYAACDAAALCMNKGGLLALVYHSFDLHWRTDTCAWECVLYAGQNTGTSAASYFSTNNATTVTHGFGFNGASC